MHGLASLQFPQFEEQYHPPQEPNAHYSAAHLQGMGRHGDTHLVHMTDKELNAFKGLGAISMNPHTGLPEMFKFMDILPYIVGIGGAMMGIPTWALALGQGALTTARTGDLGKGLTTGLLAGGLGSLTSGMGQAGMQGAAGAAPAAGAGEAAAQGGASVVPSTADAALSAASQQGVGQGAMGSVVPSTADAAAAAAKQGVVGSGGQGLGAGAGMGGVAPATQQAMQQGAAQQAWQNNMTPAERMSALGHGFTNMPDWGQFASQYKMPMWATGIGGLGYASQLQQDKYNKQLEQSNASSAAADAANLATYNKYLGAARQFNPYYYGIASGGLIGDPGTYLHAQHAASGGMIGDPGVYLHAQHAAAGGEVEGHTEHGSGIEGLLQGDGDGMSDHIDATIEGRTPAKLSNDEFVVPADVVSHLGNGSTSAGAKKLYDMLDRVRKARQGHPKQGKEINPDEHMPG